MSLVPLGFGEYIDAHDDSVVIHAVLMISVWTVLVPMGTMLPMMLKKDKTNARWFLLHRLWMLSSLALSLFAVGLVFNFKEDEGLDHFVSDHATLGLLAHSLFLIIPLLAFSRPPNLGKRKTCLRVVFEVQHRWSGRLLILLALVIQFFGVDTANVLVGAQNDTVDNVPFGSTAIVSLFLVWTFYWKCFRNRTGAEVNPDGPQKRGSPANQQQEQAGMGSPGMGPPGMGPPGMGNSGMGNSGMGPMHGPGPMGLMGPMGQGDSNFGAPAPNAGFNATGAYGTQAPGPQWRNSVKEFFQTYAQDVPSAGRMRDNIVKSLGLSNTQGPSASGSDNAGGIFYMAKRVTQLFSRGGANNDIFNPSGGGGGGYPANNGSGYPANNGSGYPANNDSGYPANNGSGGYPANNGSGYAANNGSGYPDRGNGNGNGYPAQHGAGGPSGAHGLRQAVGGAAAGVGQGFSRAVNKLSTRMRGGFGGFGGGNGGQGGGNGGNGGNGGGGYNGGYNGGFDGGSPGGLGSAGNFSSATPDFGAVYAVNPRAIPLDEI